MSEKPAEDLSYEQALELFDARLRSLEEGKLTLEQAIEAVAEGRRYLKICEAKLEAARHKIEVRPEPQPVPAAAAGEADDEPDPGPPPRDLLL
jgi:exodeoxyribonuclease VII small subunit